MWCWCGIASSNFPLHRNPEIFDRVKIRRWTRPWSNYWDVVVRQPLRYSSGLMAWCSIMLKVFNILNLSLVIHSGTFWSFRPIGKRNDPRYCIIAVKQCAKVMVWGALSGKGGRGGIWFMPVGETINAAVYQHIPEDKLLIFRQIQNVEYFQHDGAPCHKARTVMKWLTDNNIPVIGPWPHSSPDLNPIENLWIMMKRKVAAGSPTSASHLKDIIKRVWASKRSAETCKLLARSMPRRIADVLAAKGFPTKY